MHEQTLHYTKLCAVSPLLAWQLSAAFCMVLVALLVSLLHSLWIHLLIDLSTAPTWLDKLLLDLLLRLATTLLPDLLLLYLLLALAMTLRTLDHGKLDSHFSCSVPDTQWTSAG